MTFPGHPRPGHRRRLFAAIFLLSAGVLGFEIALMRMLLLASWHHFAFLVISCVLLGFGASGTALVLARAQVMGHPAASLVLLTLLTAISIPLCVAAAQMVPVEARFVPSLLWEHIGRWMLYWVLLTVPFILGASALGAALMVAGPRVTMVYGANLLGGAAGAVLAPVAMTMMAPAWLPVPMAALVLIAAILIPGGLHRTRGAVAFAGILIIGATLVIAPPHVRLDPFKYGAFVERLVAQGDAERVATHVGPRGMLEAYRSEQLHDFPFLGIGAAPPDLTVLLRDGHWAGSVLAIDDVRDAESVDHTLMAFPYEIAPASARVALLGETSGANIWLALRSGARTVDCVQSDRGFFDLLRGPLHAAGGAVLDRAPVRAIAASPRHFLDHTDETYDVIHLVAPEGSAAGSGGVGGLGQDDLLTVEGVAAGLRRLSPEGLLFVCRGIQTPPRDNIRLVATFIAALERAGVAASGGPARHLVVVRDYLGVCTIALAAPVTETRVARVRAACARRELTPVWFDTIRPAELNRPDALPAPMAVAGDWYHHATVELLSPRAESFLDGWAFDVSPPRDDRPYFRDFLRLRSLPALREAYGELWLTRAEIAFLFVLVATILIAVVAALCILAPLPLLRRGRAPRRTATAAYFGAIGIGYLVIEITLLERMTRLVGDPVLAAATTIGAMLCFSGLGSLCAPRVRSRWLPWIMVVVAGGAMVAVLGLPALSTLIGDSSPVWSCCAAAVLLAPLAFAMGLPMPSGLVRLERGAPALIPWAWGINGFASVLAAPGATLVAMSQGLTAAGAVGAAAYVVAAAVFGGLPGSRE